MNHRTELLVFSWEYIIIGIGQTQSCSNEVPTVPSSSDLILDTKFNIGIYSIINIKYLLLPNDINSFLHFIYKVILAISLFSFHQ